MGKISGLVTGLKQSLQSGDISDVTWNGRTAEQLGRFKMEIIFSPFVHIINNPIGIFIIENACFLCLKGLPEKAPHPNLYDALKTLLLSMPKEKDFLINYVFFEIQFLAEVGVGLSLSRCAVTGKTEGLFYVSPKTGCAITKEAGEKHKDKLFVLPPFLVSNDTPTDNDIFSALKITEHFLKIYFYGINIERLPLSRNYLMTKLIERIHGTKNQCNTQ
jgi:DNA repair protein RecO (recombination protein O)